MKVLIAAHIGQPWGGMSVNYENLLASSLPWRVNLTFVETSDGRETFAQGGKLSLRNFYWAARHILRFAAGLLRSKPDVAHIGTSYGVSFAKHSVMVLLARALGVRVALTPHCSIKVLLPEGRAVWRRYVLFILRRCHGLAALSREWLGLADLLPGCRVEYVPNALILRPYLDLLRGEGGGRVKLLYLGHIGKDKGSFDLIQACARLAAEGRDFTLDMLGEALFPGEMAAAEVLVGGLGLEGRVRLLAAEFGEKKMRRLAEADVLTLPSYHEGMPNSIIEAMASGLAIAATRVGGIPDMLTDGENGLLTEAGDVEGLAAALGRLMDDAALRRRLGAAARRTAQERYEMENKVKLLVDFYKRLCSLQKQARNNGGLSGR